LSFVGCVRRLVFWLSVDCISTLFRPASARSAVPTTLAFTRVERGLVTGFAAALGISRGVVESVVGAIVIRIIGNAGVGLRIARALAGAVTRVGGRFISNARRLRLCGVWRLLVLGIGGIGCPS
jgi:hypothetical protein